MFGFGFFLFSHNFFNFISKKQQQQQMSASSSSSSSSSSSPTKKPKIVGEDAWKDEEITYLKECVKAAVKRGERKSWAEIAKNFGKKFNDPMRTPEACRIKYRRNIKKEKAEQSEGAAVSEVKTTKAKMVEACKQQWESWEHDKLHAHYKELIELNKSPRERSFWEMIRNLLQTERPIQEYRDYFNKNRGPFKGGRWTEAEDLQLKQDYVVYGNHWSRYRNGRSPSAVASRARKLKLVETVSSAIPQPDSNEVNDGLEDEAIPDDADDSVECEEEE